MSLYDTVFNFPDHKSGTTLDAGISFTIVVNSVAIDFTGASAAAKFRKDRIDGPVSLEMTTDNGLFTFNSPATDGVINVASQLISLAPATYYYDIKYVLASGETKIRVGGQWTITKVATDV